MQRSTVQRSAVTILRILQVYLPYIQQSPSLSTLSTLSTCQPYIQPVSSRPLNHSAPSPPLPWTLVRGPTSDKAPQYLHTLTLPLILSP
jgi:hypothetical protein